MKKVNKCIMAILLAFAMLPLAAMAQEAKFYQMDMLYVNGTLEFRNSAVLVGDMPTVIAEEGGYRAELVSFSGIILQESAFGLEASVDIDLYDQDTGTFSIITVEADSMNFTLNMPYSTDGKQVNIYNPYGAKILEIPVMQFAQTCGDKSCQEHESRESCPSDCGGQNLPQLAKLPVVLFGCAILLLAVILFLKRRKTA